MITGPTYDELRLLVREGVGRQLQNENSGHHHADHEQRHEDGK
jgi:hypothetical protein